MQISSSKVEESVIIKTHYLSFFIHLDIWNYFEFLSLLKLTSFLEIKQPGESFKIYDMYGSENILELY